MATLWHRTEYLTSDRNTDNAVVTAVIRGWNRRAENFQVTVNRTGATPLSTDSTTGARNHARSQVCTANMRIPATPPDVDPSHLLWSEAIPPGSYATRVLGRGT